MSHHFLADNWSQNQTRPHQFFNTGNLSTSNLADQMNRPPIPPWIYLMISHVLKSLDKDLQCSRQLTPFEKLCTQNSPQRHLIAYTDNLLFENLLPNTSNACTRWEEDLSFSLTDEQWERIFLNIHKGSLNVSTQENGYKIQSRWYRTPALLNRLYPSTLDKCWRCHKDKETLFTHLVVLHPITNFLERGMLNHLPSNLL